MTTTPTSKHLTPRQRLEGLKALLRHKAHRGKILTGTVSERKTEFTNLIKSDIPKTHAECVARIEALQGKWDEIDKAKEARADFKHKQREAEYQLLFEDINEGAQLSIDGTEVMITRETVAHVKAAISTVELEEENRGEDDTDIKVPRPDAAEMEGLERTLDDWLEAEGLRQTQVATEDQAVHPDDAKPKGKGGRKPRNKAAAKTEPARAANDASDDEDDDDESAAGMHGGSAVAFN